MFLLYHGGGSGEVQLLSEYNQAIWGLIRKKAINYLTLSAAGELLNFFLAFLSSIGLALIASATILIFCSINVTQYLKLKLDAQTEENTHRFSLIADALQEIGNYVPCS